MSNIKELKNTFPLEGLTFFLRKQEVIFPVFFITEQGCTRGNGTLMFCTFIARIRFSDNADLFRSELWDKEEETVRCPSSHAQMCIGSALMSGSQRFS